MEKSPLPRMRKSHNISRRFVMRPLDPSDPRSFDNPNNREMWLEVARAIGRSLAKRDLENSRGAKHENAGSNLRKIFDGQAKGHVTRRSSARLQKIRKRERFDD